MRKSTGIFIAFLCCTTAMAADPTGTWKLDLEKSKMHTAGIAADTMTIEKTGPNSYRTTVDLTYSSGQKDHATRDRVYDGKERAVSGVGTAASGNETETCELSADGERKITQKRDGKVIATITSKVSADGKTMNNTRSDPSGEDIMVFDRVK
jgi:hypothetical protein